MGSLARFTGFVTPLSVQRGAVSYCIHDSICACIYDCMRYAHVIRLSYPGLSTNCIYTVINLNPTIMPSESSPHSAKVPVEPMSFINIIWNPTHVVKAWLSELKRADYWDDDHGLIYASTRSLAYCKKGAAVTGWILILLPCTSRANETWNFASVVSGAGTKLYVGMSEACTATETPTWVQQNVDDKCGSRFDSATVS
jgi:hypothetical protein